MSTSFYTEAELSGLGLKKYGKRVLISRFCRIYNPEMIILGDDVRIDDYTILSGKISIGSFVHIAAFCGLFGAFGIALQDFSGLSARVLIYSATDDYSGSALTNPTVPDMYRAVQGGPVTIGKHGIIGAGTVIMPSVDIGEGAAVGAMSMVTKNINPWTICMGIPARFVKERSRELIKHEDVLMRTKGEVRTENNL